MATQRLAPPLNACITCENGSKSPARIGRPRIVQRCPNNQQLKQSPQRRAPASIALLAPWVAQRLVPAAKSAAKPSLNQWSRPSFPEARGLPTLVPADYAKETGNQVSYQSVGSGAGVPAIHRRHRRFGANRLSNQGRRFHLWRRRENGALSRFRCWAAPSLRLQHPDCPNLKLTQAQLADIFLGKNHHWSALGLPSKADHRGPPLRWLRHHLCFTNSLTASRRVGKRKWGGARRWTGRRRWRQRQ